MSIKMTALELILHLAEGSTSPNTLQHIAKIAQSTLDFLEEQEDLQPYKDMTDASYLRGFKEGQKAAQGGRQGKQAPVAWRRFNPAEGVCDFVEEFIDGWEPLYPPPQAQRKWVGLTLEELLKTYRGPDVSDYIEYARTIETKLKEKNT